MRLSLLGFDLSVAKLSLGEAVPRRACEVRHGRGHKYSFYRIDTSFLSRNTCTSEFCSCCRGCLRAWVESRPARTTAQDFVLISVLQLTSSLFRSSVSPCAKWQPLPLAHLPVCIKCLHIWVLNNTFTDDRLPVEAPSWDSCLSWGEELSHFEPDRSKSVSFYWYKNGL